MKTRDIKFVLKELDSLQDRVASLEAHIRGSEALSCEKCGKSAAYSVREGKSAPGGYGAIGTRFTVIRCVLCGHERTGPV